MGEPVWALATRFPRQGEWSEADYLALPDAFPRVELSDGCLEVLPMPTHQHQAALTAILLVLAALAKVRGGWALPAGIRVRLRDGRFREPDVALLLGRDAHLRSDAYWLGASLVVEVVSGSSEDRTRDLVTKRREYAEAAIPETWIVDLEKDRISVLALDGAAYRDHLAVDADGEVRSATIEGLAFAARDVLRTG